MAQSLFDRASYNKSSTKQTNTLLHELLISAFFPMKGKEYETIKGSTTSMAARLLGADEMLSWVVTLSVFPRAEEVILNL